MADLGPVMFSLSLSQRVVVRIGWMGKNLGGRARYKYEGEREREST